MKKITLCILLSQIHYPVLVTMEQWNSLLTRFMRNGDKSQSYHTYVSLFQIIGITWPILPLAASIGHNKLTPIVAQSAVLILKIGQQTKVYRCSRYLIYKGQLQASTPSVITFSAGGYLDPNLDADRNNL